MGAKSAGCRMGGFSYIVKVEIPHTKVRSKTVRLEQPRAVRMEETARYLLCKPS